jgi:hypothetical protein
MLERNGTNGKATPSNVPPREVIRCPHDGCEISYTLSYTDDENYISGSERNVDRMRRMAAELVQNGRVAHPLRSKGWGSFLVVGLVHHEPSSGIYVDLRGIMCCRACQSLPGTVSTPQVARGARLVRPGWGCGTRGSLKALALHRNFSPCSRSRVRRLPRPSSA